MRNCNRVSENLRVSKMKMKNKIDVLEKPCKTRVLEFSERHLIVDTHGQARGTLKQFKLRLT